jgi:hypothetical protein
MKDYEGKKGFLLTIQHNTGYNFEALPKSYRTPEFHITIDRHIIFLTKEYA